MQKQLKTCILKVVVNLCHHLYEEMRVIFLRTEILSHIIEVAKQNSITKAANILYISQSALSESISQLEEELDCQIFIRTKKGVIITETGQKIISQAQRILQELNNLYEISYTAPSITNCNEKLTIGLSEKFSSSILNLTISEVLKKYPQTTFDILDMDLIRCVQALEEQKIQLAMISSPSTEKDAALELLHEKKIRCLTLPHEPVMVLVNKNSPLAKKTSVTFKNLSEETLISYSSVATVRNPGIPVKKILFLPSVDNIVHLVKLNEGISILPLMITHDILPQIEDELALIPIIDSQLYNYIIFPAANSLSNIQKFFIDSYIKNYKKIFC